MVEPAGAGLVASSPGVPVQVVLDAARGADEYVDQAFHLVIVSAVQAVPSFVCLNRRRRLYVGALPQGSNPMPQKRDHAFTASVLVSMFLLLVALFIWGGKDLVDGYRCSNGWVDPRSHARLDGQPWKGNCILYARSPMRIVAPIPSRDEAIRVSALLIFLSSAPPWVVLIARKRKRQGGKAIENGDVAASD